MKNTEEDPSRSIARGYKDRDDYLSSLADDRGIDITAVRMIADMLGPSEDFDGLVSELEDFECLGLLNGLQSDGTNWRQEEQRRMLVKRLPDFTPRKVSRMC